MNLLDRLSERCVRLRPEAAPDGLGGRSTVWAEGDGFDAVLIRREAKRVEAGQGEARGERYDAVTAVATGLKHGDVFRRVSDGAVFRVTGDAVSASASAVEIAVARCERWDGT